MFWPHKVLTQAADHLLSLEEVKSFSVADEKMDGSSELPGGGHLLDDILRSSVVPVAPTPPPSSDSKVNQKRTPESAPKLAAKKPRVGDVSVPPCGVNEFETCYSVEESLTLSKTSRKFNNLKQKVEAVERSRGKSDPMAQLAAKQLELCSHGQLLRPAGICVMESAELMEHLEMMKGYSHLMPATTQVHGEIAQTKWIIQHPFC